MPISIDDSAAAATLSSVAASASSVSVLAANNARKGVQITNDSATATLYLAYAATATTSAYTVPIGPGVYWEMPVLFRGALSAIWSAAVGSARVTELT